MYVSFVSNVMQRKVKPLHPGSIVIDILEDRGISVEEFLEARLLRATRTNLRLKEILEGKRPISYVFAFEVDLRLGIPTQLLLNLQRKVDIWDSLSE